MPQFAFAHVVFLLMLMRQYFSSSQRLKGCATAVLIALLAAALQWSVRPWVEQKIPFLFFQPAIVMAAALAGRRAGYLVTLCGFVSGLLWLLPPDTLRLSNAGDQLSLLIYTIFGLLLSRLGEGLQQSNTRASDAEQRLVLAVEDTGIGIFDLDLASNTVWLSPALAMLVGLQPSAEAVPLSSVLAQVPNEKLEESRAVLVQKFRERARSYERELQLALPDGGMRWLLLRVHIVWAGERAVRLRGACIDMTERKRVDALLDRTQAELGQQVADLHRLHDLSSRLLETTSLPEQLQLILVALADFHDARRGVVSLFDADTDTSIIETATGFDDIALAHLGSTGATHGECQVAQARRERFVIEDFDTVVDLDRRLDGLRAFARVHGICAAHVTPLIGQRGDVLGALAIYLETPRAPTARERTLADICARKAAIFTERTHAQTALEETRGRFQAVLDTSAVPFVVLTPVRDETTGNIIDFGWSYVNEAAARAMHRARETFLGRLVTDLLPARWSEAPSFHHYVDVVEQGVTREFETHLKIAQSDQWFQCVASPMRGDVAVWFADVTQRKLSEQLLQEADRRKDEFLATLAHELRNPLAPIRQAAALSRQPQATDAQKRWSHEVIERQVRHMALLLDDLLDVSRITRGVLSLRRGTHDLSAILEAAIETARPLIDEKQHVLEVISPAAPIRLNADPLRVAQIVANLLTNAAKYTNSPGRIQLHAWLEGEEVVIEVSDNGIGIEAHSLAEVFDMFTQLRTGSDRVGGGLGIGLALTKGLVELHGGTIVVRSDGLGHGSVFTVRLPRGLVPAEAAPRALAPTQPLKTPRQPAKRVLIADDNRDAAESLAALLELEGHVIELAFDGNDALRVYERFRPEVCLLDIGMPYRTGNEVAQAIRASAPESVPTLIAITGWGQEHDRRQALNAGFDHHMTKPVDPGRLLRIIAAEPAAAATR